MNEKCWPRGGLDTNQFVLDEDYFGRCLDKDVPLEGNESVNQVLYKHKNYPCNILKNLNFFIIYYIMSFNRLIYDTDASLQEQIKALER